MGEAMERIAVKMNQITMRFGDVVANDKVDFEVYKGEVHALVGENGAGKTTLMNILYGLYVPTEGTIEINGKPVSFLSAIDAIRQGIGMVHQHFMLVPTLTVADNIVLGAEPHKGMRYLKEEAFRQIEDLIKEYDMDLPLKSFVSEVSLGTQQRIEIVKALYRKADILILDEPTAVLTPQEIEELGEMIQQLKSKGKTIIIITHKLKEVLAFSDRVTVLRRGKIVGSIDTKKTTAEEITQMMVGRSVSLGGNKKGKVQSEEILSIKELSYRDLRGIEKLRNVSFTIHKGEIFGIAGIDNSGQKELTEIIAGILHPEKGSVILEGQEISRKSVKNIKKLGLGFVPQDRQRSGLAMGLPISFNLILGYHNLKKYGQKGLLDFENIKRNAIEKIEDFDIRPEDPNALTRNLSGGNQQKVVVAREISHMGNIIIADQPSRGVDIGAIELIHKTLVDARNDGKAVLLVSLELDEIMQLSDRIGVLYDGELMGIIDADEATREKIGLMMTGGSRSYETK